MGGDQDVCGKAVGEEMMRIERLGRAHDSSRTRLGWGLGSQQRSLSRGLRVGIGRSDLHYRKSRLDRLR